MSTEIAKIYSSKENKGFRLPYFYMYGSLENDFRYDICNGNVEALQRALKQGVHLVECNNKLCLMFSCFKGRKMEGCIVYIDDFKAITEAYNEFKLPFAILYSDEVDRVFKEYKSTYDLMYKLRKNYN